MALESNLRMVRKERAMYDLPRVTFLLVADALLVAMLIMVLGGCVSTPAANRYRHGDFIMNIGWSAPAAAPAPEAPTKLAVASASARG
jgi:hypothetical protein